VLYVMNRTIFVTLFCHVCFPMPQPLVAKSRDLAIAVVKNRGKLRIETHQNHIRTSWQMSFLLQSFHKMFRWNQQRHPDAIDVILRCNQWCRLYVISIDLSALWSSRGILQFHSSCLSKCSMLFVVQIVIQRCTLKCNFIRNYCDMLTRWS
jgi:hypothetical protein